jgi:hypothetical protein
VANRVTQLAIGLAVVLVVVGCAGGGGSGRTPQGGSTEGPRATFANLDLSPTGGSGAKGSAAFAKTAAGTRIELELRGLPEPGETYLAHIHPGTCEDEQHAEAPGGETSDHHDEHGHWENIGAIEYPLTPVESDARGKGSSTTVLQGVALDELFSHGPKYLNVHAAGSGDPPQLACAGLGKASQRTSRTPFPHTPKMGYKGATARPPRAPSRRALCASRAWIRSHIDLAFWEPHVSVELLGTLRPQEVDDGL